MEEEEFKQKSLFFQEMPRSSRANLLCNTRCASLIFCAVFKKMVPKGWDKVDD